MNPRARVSWVVTPVLTLVVALSKKLLALGLGTIPRALRALGFVTEPSSE